MKALVYTAPRRVELQELPRPVAKANEVLVKVRAAGICGSDLHGFLGKSKKRIPPLVLGHEFSGEIVETGAGVSRFHVGDRVAVYPLITCGQCVYCKTDRHHICPDRKVYGLHFHGALAEYASVPENCLFRMPAEMSFADGALVEPLANAIHVVDKCSPIKGRTGVIFGAGSIGLLIFWYARYAGAQRQALVDLNPKRLAILKQMGADLVINAATHPPAKVVREWTQNHGADFSVDAVGNRACRQNAVAATAAGGASVWIGLEEDLSELSGMDFISREIEIKGSYAYTRKDFSLALEILKQKLLPTKQFISEAQLEQGQAMFDQLTDRDCSIIKVIFQI